MISVCVDVCLCVLFPMQPGPCATHSEMTEWQSILPLRFVSQRAFDPAAHEHTHRWEAFAGTQNTGEETGRGRVKVRTKSLYQQPTPI